MRHTDYIIIGGGIAGVGAAEAIREYNPSSSITLISEESEPLYSRVLLPHYVKGIVPRERVYLRIWDDYEARNILVFPGVRVHSLDAAGRWCRLSDGREIEFAKALIATGGKPRALGIPGENLRGVSRFQTLGDADHMRDILAGVRRAVVGGGSFIALEYMEILARRGIPVEVVFLESSLLARHIDPEGSRMLARAYEKHGIRFTDSQSIKTISGTDKVQGIQTTGGKIMECDFVGLGVGLERDTGWLYSSGLEITPYGVQTNESLETTAGGIFAAGDACTFYDAESKKYHTHGNWANSFMQGKGAAWNMTHPDAMRRFSGVSAYSIKNFEFAYLFIGETIAEPEVQTVARVGDRSYERYFFRDARLIGAVLVNHPERQAPIVKLIQAKTPIPDISVFQEPEFSPERLIS